MRVSCNGYHVHRALFRAVVAFGGGVAACGGGEGGGESEAPVQAVVAAQTEVVTPRPFTQTIGAIGEVVPRAAHVATLSAPAAGRVHRVLVTTGQRVVAGQTLVELDQSPFRAASAAADAALATAQRAAERQKRLANEGIVPRKDAEQAQAELARARADAANAHREEALSILRSPITGIVTRMSATLGASVDPAQPLVEIADPRALDVLLSVMPAEAAQVRPAMKVALSSGQSEAGESLGAGTVVDVSGTVDTATRSVAVRVQVQTPRRPLRIGETVFGEIALSTIPNAIVVPANAIVPEGDAFKVFIVDASGLAHSRDVTVGGRAKGTVWIAKGLAAGERVVTDGAYGMQDSAKVAPLTPPATDSTRAAGSLRGTNLPTP